MASSSSPSQTSTQRPPKGTNEAARCIHNEAATVAATVAATAAAGGAVCAQKSDVLMGRGRRVAIWPGNVYFRQLISEKFDQFAFRPKRPDKVKVARDIIQAVQANGGRFLESRYANFKFQGACHTTDWKVVNEELAIQKCCFAMRELERSDRNPENELRAIARKNRPPLGKPEEAVVTSEEEKVSGDRRDSTPEQEPSKISKKTKEDKEELSQEKIKKDTCTLFSEETRKTKRKIPTSDSQDDADTSQDKVELPSLPLKKRKTTKRELAGKEPASAIETLKPQAVSGGETHFCGNHNKKTKKGPTEIISEEEEDCNDTTNDAADDEKDTTACTYTLRTPLQSSRALIQEQMLERLKQFVRQHGHAAVPPIYESDETLSDWCIAQRQLYREVIFTGYRTALGHERACLDQLERLGFVWDYAAWHWNQHYQALLSEQQQQQQQIPNKYTREWLGDQRRQRLQDGHEIPRWQRRKLEQAGVSL